MIKYFIFDIPFINGIYEDVYLTLERGKLMVVPSGPGLAIIDKDKKWHVKNHGTRGSYIRKYGTDDILVLFYGFQPNYVRNNLFDHKGTGKWFPKIVK